MKKSVFDLVKDIKEALDDKETVVIEIRRDGKPSLIFTVTKDKVGGVYTNRKEYKNE